MCAARSDSPKDIETARTLAEALPYMRAFSGQTMVIKFGGHAMGDETLAETFAQDIVLLKQVGINPVVVHGGGPQIAEMLERLGIKTEFVDGLRVTDRKTVDVVEMVLSGSINKRIVSSINAAGGTAVGLSGKDGSLIEARKLERRTPHSDSNIERILDLGFVGTPTRINPHTLEILEKSDIIPVVAPIGAGEDGETYNINADTVAGALAGALRAGKLIMLTDVTGVMDEKGEIINRLTPASAQSLLDRGAITGGMIPKLETCLEAVQNGTQAAHILDGRVAHVLLLEIFTEHGIGTMVHQAA
jgi:acetylglutamate kinase